MLYTCRLCIRPLLSSRPGAACRAGPALPKGRPLRLLLLLLLLLCTLLLLLLLLLPIPSGIALRKASRLAAGCCPTSAAALAAAPVTIAVASAAATTAIAICACPTAAAELMQQRASRLPRLPPRLAQLLLPLLPAVLLLL